jgi:hypothetical protein
MIDLTPCPLSTLWRGEKPGTGQLIQSLLFKMKNKIL